MRYFLLFFLFYSVFPSDELQDDAAAKKRSRFGCLVSYPLIIPVVFLIVSFPFSSFLSIRSGIRYPPYTEIYTGKGGEGTAAKGGFSFLGIQSFLGVYDTDILLFYLTFFLVYLFSCLSQST